MQMLKVVNGAKRASPIRSGRPAASSLAILAIRTEDAVGLIETIRGILPTGSLILTGCRETWPSIAGGAAEDGLTTRQLEILARLRDGLSNKEIGRAVDLSHFTVRNHVSQLLRHFQVATRNDLIALFDDCDI